MDCCLNNLFFPSGFPFESLSSFILINTRAAQVPLRYHISSLSDYHLLAASNKTSTMETAGPADRQSDATLDLDQGQLRTLMNPDTNGIYFLGDLHRLLSVSHHRVDKAFLQKRLLDAINTTLAECDSSNAFRHPVCNASCDWVSAPSFAAKVHCKGVE
jgi:hypothetical protein